MAQLQTSPSALRIRNIGGIEEAEVSLDTGVNVLVGENATNRTSLLRALSAVLGSNNVTLKRDSEAGWIELTINGDKYRREITRKNGSLTFSGEVYLDDEQRQYADLFAFLFERNRARNAIRQGEGLYDIVMEPIDTEAIQSEITALKTQRSEKEQRREAIQAELERLPDLYEQKESLENEIADIEDELKVTTEEIEAVEASRGESQDAKSEVEEKLDELQSKQAELSRIESNLETTEKTVESLRDDIATKEEILSTISVDEDRLSDLEQEIAETYDRIAKKESMMNELQNIIQFNREMIDEDQIDNAMFEAVRVDESRRKESESVTDQLLEDEEKPVICWTCGSKTEKSNIAEMVKRLKAVHEDMFGERRQLEERVEQLEADRDSLQEERERSETLQTEIEEAKQEIKRRERNLDQFESQRDTLSEEIASLEDKVQKLQESQDSRIIELQQQASTLEYKIQQKSSTLDEVITDIEEIEQKEDLVEKLNEQIAEIEESLSELRGRIDNIEQETINEFNNRMDEVLHILAYENIERVWIERKEQETRKGRKKVMEKQFDLHIVRESADETVYEDTVQNLSESEREVTGLIFALAGYLVHELQETVPFIILDSLEAIDSARIARLIEYFEEVVPNIAVALLPEDASELSSEFNRVTPQEL